MPTEIEATYRVVTPLFCAGVDPQRAELRLPSFKGVLRFWWRALAWSRYGGDLQRIQEQEDALFGNAGGGQSRVSMRLVLGGDPMTVKVGNVLTVRRSVVGEGARYLGYGVMEAFDGRKTKAGRLTRSCLSAPFEFTAQMRSRDLNEPELESLKSALIALGTLGGMGARSRKGYGSTVLQALCVSGEKQCEKPRNIDELHELIAGLQNSTAALPEFTALSKGTHHVLVSSEKKKPLELLDLVGRELVRFRSWGRNGRILRNIPSERRFEQDHDLMKDRGQRKTHPCRIAFGLPHNYGKQVDQQVGPYDKHLDRRASPLFIHIHECSDTPIAVLSFLPARFLPKGKSDISVGGSRVRQTPEADLYQPIHDFLNRLLDREKRKERFTDVVEVT